MWYSTLPKLIIIKEFMRNYLASLFALTNKNRVRWVIIEESNSGENDIFLGIMYKGSNVAVKLCERRFVSEVSMKRFEFERKFYPAIKKKKGGKIVFEAQKSRNENCEEILAIEKSPNFVWEEYGDLRYSCELENKKLV